MKPLREQQLRELFEVKCEMGAVPFEYVEVSSQNGANIEYLHSVIIELALSHSYMGELIPQSYLKVESVVMKLREEKQQLQQQKGDDVLPIVSLKNEFLPRVKREFGKGVDDSAAECLRALGLLHTWGVCIHFGESPLLSEFEVLDPSFLTQEVMSSLFHPDCAGYLKNGKLLHKQLRVIWPKYEQQAEFLMSVMEKFEVCFELEQQQQQDQPQPSFWEGTSVVTAYFPEQPPVKEFNSSVWPEECPAKTTQLRRKYKFNIIPKELVSRFLVRLHPKMEAKSLWRTGLYLESSSNGGKKVKVLILARLEVNELEVSVRGAEVSVARIILDIVGNEISEVSKNYAGLTMSHEDSEVIAEESGKPLKWWNLDATGEWESRTKGESDLQLLPFYQYNKQPMDSELLDKLKLVL